jgi:peptide/nickel transport system permease protein
MAAAHTGMLELAAAPEGRRWRSVRRFLVRPVTLFAVCVFGLFIVLSLFAPLIAPFGPNQPTVAYFSPPSLAYPFGTDNLGRDVLSRVIYGARVSLQVGLLAVLIGTCSGALLGIISGYTGGFTDVAAQRLIDVLQSLPGVLLALVIAAGLGASLFNLSLAIGIAIIPASTRIARAATLSVRSMPYIEAATTVGAPAARIISRHVIPNVMAPLLVIASVQLGFAIISEAALSYLGLGIPLGTPTWGNMLSGSSLLYMQQAPWMGLAPGLALTLVVMATNLLGDALRDALDPRLRGAR